MNDPNDFTCADVVAGNASITANATKLHTAFLTIMLLLFWFTDPGTA